MSKVTKEMNQLLVEATKYYSDGQYEESCNLLSELNELYFALNSENEPYYLYLYGRSLYNLGLESSDVFGSGGGIGGGEGDDDGEDSENDEEEETGEKKSKAGLFNFDEEVEEEEEEEQEQEQEEEEEEEEEDVEEEEEEQEEQEEHEEEEHEEEEQEEEDGSSDFESAWSVLEISRALYEKRLHAATDSASQDELKVQLSEIFDILGLISLEMENFKQAKEDFLKCLSLREAVYAVSEPNHRLIIEANYKLSMALEFDPTEYKNSEMYLQKVIAMLGARIDEGKAEAGDAELLKDLQDKLRETELNNKENAATEEKQLQQMKEMLGMPSLSSSSAQAAPVNDLTSMVVKKNKKQEKRPASEEESSESKKQKN